MRNLILAVLFIGFIGCKNEKSKLEKPNESLRPQISYNLDTIKTWYLTSGSSSEPKIERKGGVGDILLQPVIEGISINDSTGELSWSKSLPKGGHEIKVIVKNLIGSDTAKVYIDHSLQGKFIGTYNWDGKSYFYQMEFNRGGSMIVSSDSPRTKNTGSGTWEIDSLDRLVVNYKYPSGEKASALGKIISKNQQVSYEGIWFDELGTLPENEGEDFKMIYVEDKD